MRCRVVRRGYQPHFDETQASTMASASALLQRVSCVKRRRVVLKRIRVAAVTGVIEAGGQGRERQVYRQFVWNRIERLRCQRTSTLLRRRLSEPSLPIGYAMPSVARGEPGSHPNICATERRVLRSGL